MGRIGLEKLVASLRDEHNIKADDIIVIGDAALVVHDVIKEVEKPLVFIHNKAFNVLADRLNQVVQLGDHVFGQVKFINYRGATVITTKLPDYHCAEEIGPFWVETKQTILLSLIRSSVTTHKEKIDKVFASGGTIVLDSWPSDIDSLKLHYSPDSYELVDGDLVGHHEVILHKSVGIESGDSDSISMKHLGKMYFITA